MGACAHLCHATLCTHAADLANVRQICYRLHSSAENFRAAGVEGDRERLFQGNSGQGQGGNSQGNYGSGGDYNNQGSDYGTNSQSGGIASKIPGKSSIRCGPGSACHHASLRGIGHVSALTLSN